MLFGTQLKNSDSVKNKRKRIELMIGIDTNGMRSFINFHEQDIYKTLSFSGQMNHNELKIQSVE